MYLWWVAYTSKMHGHLYIILKESIKYIPVLGTGMMFYGFIFLSRKWAKDKERFMYRLRKLSSHHQGPMSGSSFLDTIVRDDKNKDPLYIIETSAETTVIYRLDHPRDEAIKAATIQWPVHPVRTRGKSGRSVQIGNGSWREAEDLLKSGPLGNTACVFRFPLAA